MTPAARVFIIFCTRDHVTITAFTAFCLHSSYRLDERMCWLQKSMKWFNDDEWSWNGLRQPYRVMERYPDLVHVDPHLQVSSVGTT